VSRTGFLLAEDEALKLHLSNITVSDDTSSSRKVRVYFRYPETETEKDYPFITIDMVSINHARNRQHSEHILYYNNSSTASSAGITEDHPNYLDYFPSETTKEGMQTIANTEDAAYLKTDSFIPVDLTYQVATYSRNALHDRYLTAYILRNVFKYRNNFILIPADNTLRRLDLLNWSQGDLLDVEGGYRKRIFRKIYNVQINSEIPVSDLLAIKQVSSIVGTIKGTEDVATSINLPLSEDF
jgi:hypothetical protein